MNRTKFLEDVDSGQKPQLGCNFCSIHCFQQSQGGSLGHHRFVRKQDGFDECFGRIIVGLPCKNHSKNQEVAHRGPRSLLLFLRDRHGHRSKLFVFSGRPSGHYLTRKVRFPGRIFFLTERIGSSSQVARFVRSLFFLSVAAIQRSRSGEAIASSTVRVYGSLFVS